MREKDLKDRKMYDVVVIGGGASGLLAAITAARNGAKVIILEQKEKTGKKILSTGNGKCNYTNERQGISYYRGENPAFVVPAFKQFGFRQTVDFFEEIGLTPKVKNGYYYPASEQAAAVLEVLRLEANYLRVREVCNCKIEQVKKRRKKFFIDTNCGDFLTESVIFATGLLAAPKTGSDGSAFSYIENFGHHFIPIVPALVPLKAKQNFFKALAGIRTEAKLTIFVENQKIAEEYGELQLTDYGVSGIPVFQLSRFATRALEEKKAVKMKIDFLPNFSEDDVFQMCRKRVRKGNQKKTMCECFVGLFNRKLIEILLKEAGIGLGEVPDRLPIPKIEKLVQVIKELEIDIIGSKSFEQAQVCAGGVDTDEICADTMESEMVSGLFFAGEVVDIDGKCGGYNLQWAWTSGYVAGFYAAKNALLSSEEYELLKWNMKNYDKNQSDKDAD